jgi:predicted dehydrogenase
MSRIAEEMGRRIFVVKSTRYNPILIAIKEQFDTNSWGPIYSFQLNCFWNRPTAYYEGSWKGTMLDGGTLYTQFSHYIDALLWLFGEIKSTTGFRKNMAHGKYILSEDSGVAAVEFKNGVIGGINWSVNSYQKNMEVSLSILAEKASIRIGGLYFNKIDSKNTHDSVPAFELLNAANDYGFYKGSMSNHDKVYENLVKALNDPLHPFTNAEDGLRTVEAIEKIYSSIALNNDNQ